MNVQVEHQENHTVRLTVDVEPERMQKAMQNAAKRVGNKLNIPGFRRGKAPYNVIARYVGAEALVSEAIEDIGDAIYKQALDETKIEPYAMAQLENIKAENGFQLVFNVPKQPEIDLGNYRDAIRLPYETKAVSDEDVARFMHLTQDRQAVIEPASRPIQLGDQVKLHLTGIVTVPHVHDHEHADEAEAAEHNHPAFDEEPVDEEAELFVRIDDDEYLPGFSEQLVGLSAGEEKTMLLVFTDNLPEARKDLIGGRAELTAKIEEVRNVTLPVLNDDFAKKVSDGKFETLLDYRIDARKNLQETLDRETKASYGQTAIEELVKGTTFKYPEIAISETLDDMIAELKSTFSERGLALEDYLRIEKRTMDSLREDYRPAAIRRLRQALALGKLIEVEHLSVSGSEIDAKIDDMAKQFGEQAAIFKDMLNNPDSRNQIGLDMLRDQAIDRLVAIARGENPTIEPLPTVPAELNAVPVVVDGTPSAETSSETPAEPPAAEPLA